MSDKIIDGIETPLPLSLNIIDGVEGKEKKRGGIGKSKNPLESKSIELEKVLEIRKAILPEPIPIEEAKPILPLTEVVEIEEKPNESRLAGTQRAVNPHLKKLFRDELIKKEEPTTTSLSSSPPHIKGTNYSRRNVSTLKGEIETIIDKQGLDALNVEENGIFKARKDKNIKNVGGIHHGGK